MFLGDVESCVEIFQGIVFAESVVIDEIGTVAVDEGAKSEAVLERQVEVLNVDVFVGRGLALAPEQETLLGCHFLHGNVLNRESQNYGPNHAQGHLQVSIDDL